MPPTNPRNVLFITRWYPTKEDPMFGLFIRNHALALQSCGWKVTVVNVKEMPPSIISGDVFAEAGKDKRGWLRESVSEYKSPDDYLGVKEIVVYYRKVRGLSLLLQALAWIRGISIAFRFEKPSIIHAHILTRAAFVALITSKLYNIPYLITEHWSRYYDENLHYKGFIRKYLTGMVLKNTASRTVVSRRLAESMRDRGLDYNYEILPNVINTSVFRPGDQKYDTFTFISVTCFEEKSKNLKMLICAAEELKKEGYTFDLVLVGDGEDRSMIEQYARERINVVFKGTLTPAETAEVLRASHCLVLSSNYETFGIVVIEALSSGVPVITTDVADLKEIVTSDCGIVTEPNDIEGLKQAMREMMNKQSTFDQEKMRSMVTNKYSFDAVGNQLTLLYHTICR